MYSTRSKRKRKKRPSTTSRLVGSVIEQRKTAARRDHEASGIQVTHGSHNVFEDVGFEAEEAAKYAMPHGNHRIVYEIRRGRRIVIQVDC